VEDDAQIPYEGEAQYEHRELDEGHPEVALLLQLRDELGGGEVN